MSVDDILASVNAKARSVTEHVIIRDMAAAQAMGVVYCSRMMGLSTKQFRHILMELWRTTSRAGPVEMATGLQHAMLMTARAVEKLHKEAAG